MKKPAVLVQAMPCTDFIASREQSREVVTACDGWPRADAELATGLVRSRVQPLRLFVKQKLGWSDERRRQAIVERAWEGLR